MFINVLSQVVILMLLILLGFILTKCKILTDEGIKSMTDMVLLLVTPCVIIKSFMREFDKTALKNLLISFLIAVLVHIGFIFIATVFMRAKNISSQRVLRFGVIFTNCGYMSLPLQQALLGEDGVFFGSSFIAIFNLFVWSYGVLLMTGDRKYLTPKKLFINPGLIGIALGLIIFLFSIPIPEIIKEPISYMAALNTPLPMIIIGFHLANSKLSEEIRNPQCLKAIIVRLFLMPLLALGVMYLLGVRGNMLISSTISCCAPTAAITTMFSAKYSADTSLSVSIVSLTTVVSLISIPLIVTLAQTIA